MSNNISIYVSKTEMIRYKVTLTEKEHSELKNILKKWKHSPLKFRNACIFLNSAKRDFGPKCNNGTIARILHINTKTVERLKQRFVEEGFDACMVRKPYPEVTNIKADGDFEAHLIQKAVEKDFENHYDRLVKFLAPTNNTEIKSL